MERILFATDFSDSCKNAFEYLKGLIGNRDVKVDLVHVYDIPIVTASSIPHNAIEGMIDEKKGATIRALNEYRDQLLPNQIGKIYPVYGVYPSTEIAKMAQATNADMIVTALRQKYNLVDRIIGSVTAHTIQKSELPVLAIPNGAKYRQVKEILFPTEMSIHEPISAREQDALEWLNAFYKNIEPPKIHMIHISGKGGLDHVDIVFSNKPFPDVDFTISSASDIDEGLLNYLKNEKINMIAMYKPNRNLWERIYHSSTTRKLLYQSRLPLLIF